MQKKTEKYMPLYINKIRKLIVSLIIYENNQVPRGRQGDLMPFPTMCKCKRVNAYCKYGHCMDLTHT